MIHGLLARPYRTFAPEVGQINWSHPLAQGLWFAASFGQNTLNLRDMVSGRRMSTAGTVSLSKSTFGRSLNNATGGDHNVNNTGRPTLPSTTIGTSIFIVARAPTGNARKRSVRLGNTANGTIAGIDFGNGAATRRLVSTMQKTGGSFDEQLILASYVADQDYRVGMSHRAGDVQRGYLGGILKVTGGSTVAAIANPDDIYIGSSASGNLSLGGHVYLVYVWARDIGNNGHAWIGNEPFAFFRPYGRAQWLVPKVAAGGTTYTVSDTDKIFFREDVFRKVLYVRDDQILLSDTALVQAIRGILMADQILLGDSALPQAIRGVLELDRLMVSDNTTRKVELTVLDRLLLSDVVASTVIKAIFAQDGIQFADDVFRAVLLRREDPIAFLDQVTRQALVVSRDGVLLSDTAALSVVRGILVSDAIVIFDTGFSSALRYVLAQDRVLLDTLVRRIVALMVRDGVLLSDAISTVLTSAEVALIFARVDVADLLGRTTRTRDLLTRKFDAQDYLGRTVGTKRQIRGDIH